eukprot:3697083-Amphidinium_carterae.1
MQQSSLLSSTSGASARPAWATTVAFGGSTQAIRNGGPGAGRRAFSRPSVRPAPDAAPAERQAAAVANANGAAMFTSKTASAADACPRRLALRRRRIPSKCPQTPQTLATHASAAGF